METKLGSVAAIMTLTAALMPDVVLPPTQRDSGRGFHAGQYRRGCRYLPSDAQRARSWRGDGVKPTTTRQQRRYAARRAGVVTGRTVERVLHERLFACESNVLELVGS